MCDIYRCIGFFRKSCNTVIKTYGLTVNVSCCLRIYDDDAVTLHNTHHGLNGSSIDNELFLRNSTAKLEPVAPCGSSEYEFACDEVRRSGLGKTVDDHRIQVRLVIGYDNNRALVINEFHVGLNLDMRICADQRHDYMRSQKSEIEFAGVTTYVIVTRCLRTGCRITGFILHLITPIV